MSELTHDVVIALHALAGVACFVAGASALRVSSPRSRRFLTYVVSLVAMWLFPLGRGCLRLASHLRGYALALCGLAWARAVHDWRGTCARMRLRTQGEGWRPRYIDDVGFTLISLFDGFVIVTALDLGAPGSVGDCGCRAPESPPASSA